MGQNEIANPNVDSNIGLQDELGMEALVQAKEQLKKELKIFSDNKSDLEKGKINFSKQWEVDKRLYALQLEGDNIKPLDPKTKLEAMDEYFELVKEKIRAKQRQDEFNFNQQMEAFDKQIAVMQEQIDSAEKKLKEME
jgi:hypothetical protein